MKNKNINKPKKGITRKEALKKIGTYTAFTALGTMILLNPAQAQETSVPPSPKRQNPVNPRR